ncbi:MAG: hypothetical protein ACYS8X_11760 [Planctomycetota bacterium]|jgi:hypothetical protein
MITEQAVALPTVVTEFCFPIMGIWRHSLTSAGIFFFVWGLAFGLPLLAVLLTWQLASASRVRRWYLLLAICELCWILLMGAMPAIAWARLPVGTPAG